MGGDQTETEGMASNYQFTVRGEPNEGKPATLEHHFQIGGPRYEPNMELVKKINKEYEDYVAWEKAETEKAKELEDEMKRKDDALKEKKNESWDPKKYFSDLATIRGELEQNRLFSEYANNAVQNWMKKKEAAAQEMNRAVAAWTSRKEEAETKEAELKEVKKDEERSETLPEPNRTIKKKVLAESRRKLQKSSEAATAASSKAKQEKDDKTAIHEKLEEEFENVLQKVCERMMNEEARVYNKVRRKFSDKDERMDVESVLSEEKAKMEMTCSNLDKLMMIKVSQKNKLADASLDEEMKKREEPNEGKPATL